MDETCGYREDEDVCARPAGHRHKHQTEKIMRLQALFDAATPAGETSEAREDRLGEFYREHGLT